VHEVFQLLPRTDDLDVPVLARYQLRVEIADQDLEDRGNWHGQNQAEDAAERGANHDAEDDQQRVEMDEAPDPRRNHESVLSLPKREIRQPDHDRQTNV